MKILQAKLVIFFDIYKKIAPKSDFFSVRCKSTPQSHKLCRGPRLCKV